MPAKNVRAPHKPKRETLAGFTHLDTMPIRDNLFLRLCVMWLNDPEVVKFSEQRHRRHTLASQRKYISSFDQKASILWAVCVLKMQIGSITAHCDWNNRVANVGIMVGDKSYWGKQCGSSAWAQACDILFSAGIRKIEAGCCASNKGMLGIFKKTGMKVEARIKDHFLVDGKPVDMILVGKWK